jgi:tyrosine-protein phosphatase SIW14
LVYRSSVRARTIAIIVASTLSLSAPLAADTRVDNIPASTRAAVSRIHIDNFGLIDDHYFRGAQPEGHDYADLATLGVKTVINLTSDDGQPGEQGRVEQAGMKYVHIPMTMHTGPTTAQLAEFLGIVNDPAAQPVYVHCVGGKHRTGVMTAVYRMTVDGWSADRAFAEMKQYKFGFDFMHPEFKHFVYSYHPDAAAQAQTQAPDVPAVHVDN